VTATELDLERAWIALVLAALDRDDERCELILHRDDDPDFPYKVLMRTMRSVTAGAHQDPELHKEFRAEMAAALYRLAQADSAV
jgi:hypothetical protein